MSNQPIDNNAISDEELQAASGGVSADGQDLGKNVTFDGSTSVTINKLVANEGDTVTFG